MVNEARRVFNERLPEAAKDDQALHALILDAWDQATPPPPPPVLVQRLDFADGSPPQFEVVDRRRTRFEGRVVATFEAAAPTRQAIAAAEALARQEQMKRLPVGGSAINLAAVDTDEYFHDTDYELLGNQQFYGVLSGCDVTFDAANMTLDIAAGSILFNGTYTAVAAATDALTLVADGSNERWAYVSLNSSGVGVLVSGDPAASSSVEPTKPELGDRVLLYMVKIQAAQTIANNAEYKLDKRISIRFPVTIRKAADETVNNSATLQNDDHFAFAVTNGETWRARLTVFSTSAATASQGVRMAFTFPASSTATAGLMSIYNVAGVATQSQVTPAAITTGTAFFNHGAGVATQAYTVIDAYFVVTATGTVQFQWAQDTANASNTTVEAGSNLEIQRVA